MAISENDIIIENTDVKIFDGDFSIESANEQNIKHILISQPGQYIGAASVGARVWRFQNDSITDFRTVLSVIAQELIKDGYSYPDFINDSDSLDSLGLIITAERRSEPKREVI